MAWSPPALSAGIVWVSAPGDYATFNSNHTPDGTLNVPYIFSSRLPRPLGAVQPVESALNRFGRESLFETKLSRRALPAQPSLPATVRQVAPSLDGHVV